MESNFKHGGIEIRKIESVFGELNVHAFRFDGFMDKSTVKPAEEYVMRVVGGMDEKYLV